MSPVSRGDSVGRVVGALLGALVRPFRHQLSGKHHNQAAGVVIDRDPLRTWSNLDPLDLEGSLGEGAEELALHAGLIRRRKEVEAARVELDDSGNPST